MNRQEIIKMLQNGFCPALLPDKAWEVVGTLRHKMQQIEGIGKWSKTLTLAFDRCCDQTLRLDPDYTETMEPEYVDHAIKCDEDGDLYYAEDGLFHLLSCIPESKLGGYIFEDGTILLDVMVFQDKEGDQWVTVQPDENYADFKRVFAKKVRVYK